MGSSLCRGVSIKAILSSRPEGSEGRAGGAAMAQDKSPAASTTATRSGAGAPAEALQCSGTVTDFGASGLIHPEGKRHPSHSLGVGGPGVRGSSPAPTRAAGDAADGAGVETVTATNAGRVGVVVKHRSTRSSTNVGRGAIVPGGAGSSSSSSLGSISVLSVHPRPGPSAGAAPAPQAQPPPPVDTAQPRNPLAGSFPSLQSVDGAVRKRLSLSQSLTAQKPPPSPTPPSHEHAHAHNTIFSPSSRLPGDDEHRERHLAAAPPSLKPLASPLLHLPSSPEPAARPVSAGEGDSLVPRGTISAVPGIPAEQASLPGTPYSSDNDYTFLDYTVEVPAHYDANALPLGPLSREQLRNVLSAYRFPYVVNKTPKRVVKRPTPIIKRKGPPSSAAGAAPVRPASKPPIVASTPNAAPAAKPAAAAASVASQSVPTSSRGCGGSRVSPRPPTVITPRDGESQKKKPQLSAKQTAAPVRMAEAPQRSPSTSVGVGDRRSVPVPSASRSGGTAGHTVTPPPILLQRFNPARLGDSDSDSNDDAAGAATAGHASSSEEARNSLGCSIAIATPRVGQLRGGPSSGTRATGNEVGVVPPPVLALNLPGSGLSTATWSSIEESSTRENQRHLRNLEKTPLIDPPHLARRPPGGGVVATLPFAECTHVTMKKRVPAKPSATSVLFVNGSASLSSRVEAESSLVGSGAPPGNQKSKAVVKSTPVGSTSAPTASRPSEARSCSPPCVPPVAPRRAPETPLMHRSSSAGSRQRTYSTRASSWSQPVAPGGRCRRSVTPPCSSRGRADSSTGRGGSFTATGRRKPGSDRDLRRALSASGRLNFLVPLVREEVLVDDGGARPPSGSPLQAPVQLPFEVDDADRVAQQLLLLQQDAERRQQEAMFVTCKELSDGMRGERAYIGLASSPSGSSRGSRCIPIRFARPAASSRTPQDRPAGTRDDCGALGGITASFFNDYHCVPPRHVFWYETDRTLSIVFHPAMSGGAVTWRMHRVPVYASLVRRHSTESHAGPTNSTQGTVVPESAESELDHVEVVLHSKLTPPLATGLDGSGSHSSCLDIHAEAERLRQELHEDNADYDVLDTVEFMSRFVLEFVGMAPSAWRTARSAAATAPASAASPKRPRHTESPSVPLDAELQRAHAQGGCAVARPSVGSKLPSRRYGLPGILSTRERDCGTDSDSDSGCATDSENGTADPDSQADCPAGAGASSVPCVPGGGRSPLGIAQATPLLGQHVTQDPKGAGRSTNSFGKTDTETMNTSSASDISLNPYNGTLVQSAVYLLLPLAGEVASTPVDAVYDDALGTLALTLEKEPRKDIHVLLDAAHHGANVTSSTPSRLRLQVMPRSRLSKHADPKESSISRAVRRASGNDDRHALYQTSWGEYLVQTPSRATYEQLRRVPCNPLALPPPINAKGTRGASRNNDGRVWLEKRMPPASLLRSGV